MVNISTFDLNRVRALHFLLEEAHVGRAAAHLGITPAAASNALGRLRHDFGDPLLVKQGRGLIRTRLGEELRQPCRAALASATSLLRAAHPFAAASYEGELPIAMADHVARVLLPALDHLVRDRAPRATLAIAAIPQGVASWLEKTAGAMVGPHGAFAAFADGDDLAITPFYCETYVCAMRVGHPAALARWDLDAYLDQRHVLVTPRGLTQRSDVDDYLCANGQSRQVVRVVPNFALALGLVRASDLITTMPARFARCLSCTDIALRDLPIPLSPLDMKIAVHPMHASDSRTRFLVEVLRDALPLADGRDHDRDILSVL